MNKPHIWFDSTYEENPWTCSNGAKGGVGNTPKEAWEDYVQQIFLIKYRKLVKNMSKQSLGFDFTKVLHDNLWNLYEE